MQIKLPQCIQEQLEQLDALCKKYPRKIPTSECAAFLQINVESLKGCIENRTCPFALGWLKKNANNRAFFIPTATFYFWFMQTNGILTVKESSK